MNLQKRLVGCGVALATFGMTAVGDAHAETVPCPENPELQCFVTTTRQVKLWFSWVDQRGPDYGVPGPFLTETVQVGEYLNDPPPTPLNSFYKARLYQDGVLVASGKLEGAGVGGFDWNFTGTVVGPDTTVVWSNNVEMVLVLVTTG
jgi:hypothetical protein